MNKGNDEEKKKHRKKSLSEMIARFDSTFWASGHNLLSVLSNLDSAIPGQWGGAGLAAVVAIVCNLGAAAVADYEVVEGLPEVSGRGGPSAWLKVRLANTEFYRWL